MLCCCSTRGADPAAECPRAGSKHPPAKRISIMERNTSRSATTLPAERMPVLILRRNGKPPDHVQSLPLSQSSRWVSVIDERSEDVPLRLPPRTVHDGSFSTKSSGHRPPRSQNWFHV